MDFNISKMRLIFQPIMQILIFVVLYTLTWKFLYDFNFVKKHELWDLTTVYLFGCFTIVSLISGVFLLTLKKINYIAFFILIIFFACLTFNDFISSPKIILLSWIEATFSIFICNFFFIYFSKNRDRK